MVKLFVGLGNPGPEYEATRHNAGFWWIDALSRELKAPLSLEKSYHGQVARVTVNGQNVWLLKPLTFMNVSGKSVVHREPGCPPGGSHMSDQSHVLVEISKLNGDFRKITASLSVRFFIYDPSVPRGAGRRFGVVCFSR